VHQDDGTLSPELLTNLGLTSEPEPKRKWRPGSVLLVAASVLLLALAAAQGYVSWRAQYGFVLSVKGARLPSALEALGLDAGAVVFALIALARARLGHSAVIERVLNLACAGGSLTMNLLAADLGSPRAVAVYVLPALLYIAGSDRLIALARHHALGDVDLASGGSGWRLAGAAVLYGLRLVLAPAPTARGLRRWVLDSTPLPAVQVSDSARPADAPAIAEAVTPALTLASQRQSLPAGSSGRSKKAVLLDLYRKHEHAYNREMASRVAAELAPKAGLQAGSARSYIYDEMAARRPGQVSS
jgi:hypothetical protein